MGGGSSAPAAAAGLTQEKDSAEDGNWLDAVVQARERAKAIFLETVGTSHRSALDNLRVVAKKSATADPDMWTCVANSVERTVDAMMDQIDSTMTISLKNRYLIQSANDEELSPSKGRWCRCFMRLRAFILHHYIPHNKSVFGKIKNPVWWLIVIATLVWSWCIRMAMFSFVLFLHCVAWPPDEYQLTLFVVRLKVSQFVSAGLYSMILGVMTYYYCISTTDTAVLKCVHHDSVGGFRLETLLFDYVGTWALGWVAGCAVTRSKYAKRPGYIGCEPEAEREAVGCCFFKSTTQARGRKLHLALWCDTVLFLLTFLTLVVITMLTSADEFFSQDWWNLRLDTQVKGNCFWFRVLYGMFALPWLFTTSPISSYQFSTLTSARPTGYNVHGACVRWMVSQSAQGVAGLGQADVNAPDTSVPPARVGRGTG